MNHAASVDIGDVQFSNLALGLSLGFALLLAGVIIVRRSTRTNANAPVDVAGDVAPATGRDRSGTSRMRQGRLLPRGSLLGLAVLLPIPVMVLLRDNGRTAAAKREHTIWAERVRLVTDVSGRPIRPADLDVGELVNAVPLATDPDGFVVALSDVTEPVGPSYWERDA